MRAGLLVQVKDASQTLAFNTIDIVVYKADYCVQDISGGKPVQLEDTVKTPPPTQSTIYFDKAVCDLQDIIKGQPVQLRTLSRHRPQYIDLLVIPS